MNPQLLKILERAESEAERLLERDRARDREATRDEKGVEGDVVAEVSRSELI